MKRSGPLRKRAKNSRAVIPLKVRHEVEERSGGICEFVWDGVRCVWPATEKHHVLARSQGGKHTKENLLDGCGFCHAYCKNEAKDAIKRGFVKLMGAFK